MESNNNQEDSNNQENSNNQEDSINSININQNDIIYNEPENINQNDQNQEEELEEQENSEEHYADNEQEEEQQNYVYYHRINLITNLINSNPNSNSEINERVNILMEEASNKLFTTPEELISIIEISYLGNLQYTDELTLGKSLLQRQVFKIN